jgi:hypothetical protein
MSESVYPMLVGEAVATLSELFRHQGRSEIVEILDNAHARFDEINYDNWNGGTYTWALCLEVPVPIFASSESRLTEIEKEIGAKLAYFERKYSNHLIGEVTISPILSGSPLLGTRMAPSDLEVRGLWSEGRFRLFLSHLSADKVAVASLKAELEIYGVSAFVAHEDIQPSLPWQDEIILGLRSMHALAALVTPQFHNSDWTDQEIGWALGRGIPVISIKLGTNPHGFAGKFQALTGSLAEPKVLALSIVNTLIANTQTHGEMRRAIVKAFSGSRSFVQSQALRFIVVRITDFTDEEKSELQRACVENYHVSNAHHVANAIFSIVGRPVEPAPPASTDDEVPF